MPEPQRQSERIFEGAKFNIEKLQVQTRDGKQVQREVVVHPGAVVILPLLADGRVVMIRNRRYAIGETLWELPAGTLEPPEPPHDCAARELEEETGYQAGEIRTLCRFYTSPGICNEQIHAFLAVDLEKTEQDLQGTEQIEVVPVEWDRLLEMIHTHEVQDAKTIATVLYYQDLSRR